MAKDKKQDRNLGGSQNAGRSGEKKAPKPQDIDVSSESLEEVESDSDLDIQALLRKYMPDYDKEEEEPAEGGVLSKLKGSAGKAVELDLDDADLEDFELPEPAEEEEEPFGFAGLDAAFSSAPADFAAEDHTSRQKSEPMGDFDFTDDIPRQAEEDGGLEDDEGIYEDDDDDRISRAPRRKEPKQKKSLFSFGGRTKKKKELAYEEELLQLAEEEAEAETRSDDLFIDEEPVSDVGAALMDSMALDEEEADEEPLAAFMPSSLLKEDEAALRLFDDEPEEEPEEAPVFAEESAEGSLSDAEMLRLAEELLGGNAAKEPAEDAVSAEEEAEPMEEAPDIPADDDFDPTDINLMVAFGMDDGGDGKKKAGKTAKQLGDKLEHERAARDGAKVKLDRPEYVDRSQNAEIEKGYRYKMVGLWVRLGLCSVFTILLMLFENIEVLAKLFTGTAKQFGGVFDPAVYPVVYAMVSLQLMLLACLCAHEQILKGFGYLFRGIPRPESMTSMMTVAGILYTIVIARITVQSDEPVMFNFVVAVAALMTLVGDIYNTRREILNFKVVSSDKPKHIVCRVSDEQSRGETTAFSEEEDVCDVMRIEKADFINGFYNRMNTPDGSTNVFMSCAMGVMAAAAVLFGIFASVRGGTAVAVAISIAEMASMGATPMSMFFTYSYPFYKANQDAYEMDSTIVGESSLEEYAGASIISFDDKNVFPSYSVKVQNIRIYNNARIDRVLYYAASVFAKAGGPLQDVFEIATLEMGHSENVQIFDTENGFLAAEVDGVNIIFGSGAALLKKGLKIRRQDMEDDVDLSDELSIMYMFREDKLVAKMYIQYVMDSDIELILGQFQNSGLYGCVRTFDPNIDERMIAKKVKMKRIPLKVVRYNGAEEVGTYTEKVDSGLVTSGSPKSLLQIISYCDKVLHTKKTNIALAILAILVGAAIMMLLVLSGSIGIMNSLFVIIYQLLWLVPMLLSSKMFIR